MITTALERILGKPAAYEWKSRLFSLGRRPVHRYLTTVVQQGPQARILEVGCGTGRHTGALTGARVGVDLARPYVRFAHEFRSGKYAVMDGAQLGLATNTFDTAFCVGLLHHLPDHQVTQVVEELQRVVHGAGRVVVVDAVVPPPTNPLGRMVFQRDRGEHLRTLDRLESLLAEKGFRLDCPNLPGGFPYARAGFLWEAKAV